MAADDDGEALAAVLRACRHADASPQDVWRAARAELDAAAVARVETRLPARAVVFRRARDERHTHCACLHPDLREDLQHCVCIVCGVERAHSVGTEATEEWDKDGDTGPGRVLKREYSREARFRGLLHQFAGALAVRVDDATLEAIDTWLAGRRVCREACTATDVRRALRALKRPRLYDVACGITAQLRRERPTVTTWQIYQARNFFSHAMAALPRAAHARPVRRPSRYLPSYRVMLAHALASAGFAGAAVYCADLTHRRTRARVHGFYTPLVANTLAA